MFDLRYLLSLPPFAHMLRRSMCIILNTMNLPVSCTPSSNPALVMTTEAAVVSHISSNAPHFRSTPVTLSSILRCLQAPQPRHRIRCRSRHRRRRCICILQAVAASSSAATGRVATRWVPVSSLEHAYWVC